MIRFRPAILQAYPNPAYIFSQFIRRKGIRMPPLKSVILTAEPIHDYQRQAVEEVFNAPVYTFYGARESGYAGVECDMHDGYHVNCSSLYVEFLEGNSDVRPGDMGNIVFTDLLNMDMPLIRYMIEDMGIPVPGSCPCGSALPKMKFSAGRETDVFVTPDGKYVPGVALAGDIGDCEGIAALQMIQDKPDQLVVKIVKSEKFSEKDIAVLDKQIFTYFKHAVQVTKEFVDEIPKTKSGKIRLYISNVPKHGDCL
jgi:phenylacetate-CoA ligase